MQIVSLKERLQSEAWLANALEGSVVEAPPYHETDGLGGRAPQMLLVMTLTLAVLTFLALFIGRLRATRHLYFGPNGRAHGRPSPSSPPPPLPLDDAAGALLTQPYNQVSHILDEDLPQPARLDPAPPLLPPAPPPLANRQMSEWVQLNARSGQDDVASHQFDYVLHALDVDAFMVFHGVESRWIRVDPEYATMAPERDRLVLPHVRADRVLVVPRSFYVTPYVAGATVHDSDTHLFLHDVLGMALAEARVRAAAAARFRLSGLVLEQRTLHAPPPTMRRKATALLLSRLAVLMAHGAWMAPITTPDAEHELSVAWAMPRRLDPQTDEADEHGGSTGGEAVLDFFAVRARQLLRYHLDGSLEATRAYHKQATRAPALRTFRAEYDAIDNVARQLADPNDELARVLASHMLSHGGGLYTDLTPYDASAYRVGPGLVDFAVIKDAICAPPGRTAIYCIRADFGEVAPDPVSFYYASKRILVAAAYLEQTINAQEGAGAVERTKRRLGEALEALKGDETPEPFPASEPLGKRASAEQATQLRMTQLLRGVVGKPKSKVFYLHEHTFWHRVAPIDEVVPSNAVAASNVKRSANKVRLVCPTPYDICGKLGAMRGAQNQTRLFMAGFSLRRLDDSLEPDAYPFAQRPFLEALAGDPGRLLHFSPPQDDPTLSARVRDALRMLREAWLESRQVYSTETASLAALAPQYQRQFQTTPERFNVVVGLALDTLLFPSLLYSSDKVNRANLNEQLKFVDRSGVKITREKTLLRLKSADLKSIKNSPYQVAQTQIYLKKYETMQEAAITNPSWPAPDTFGPSDKSLRRGLETACYDVFLGRLTEFSNAHLGYSASDGHLALSAPITYWIGDRAASLQVVKNRRFSLTSADMGQQHLLTDYALACVHAGKTEVPLALREWEALTLRRAIVANAFSVVPLLDTYFTWRARKHANLRSEFAAPFSAYAELAAFYEKLAASGDRRFPNVANLLACDVLALAVSMQLPHGLRPLAVDAHDQQALERIVAQYDALGVAPYVIGSRHDKDSDSLYVADSRPPPPELVTALKERGIVPQWLDSDERGTRMRQAQAEDLCAGTLELRHFVAQQALLLPAPDPTKLRVPLKLGAYLQSLSWPSSGAPENEQDAWHLPLLEASSPRAQAQKRPADAERPEPAKRPRLDPEPPVSQPPIFDESWDALADEPPAMDGMLDFPFDLDFEL